MREHNIQIQAAYFDAILSGEKNFLVYRDNQGYQKGDILIFGKYGTHNSKFLSKTGFQDWDGRVVSQYFDINGVARIEKRISYILTGGQLGLKPGYVVMGLETLPEIKE